MIINLDSFRYPYEVLEGNEYSFMFDDLIVMDAGCNIGSFSLWVYPRAKTIHAIDPSTKHLDLFKKTIKDNGITNIITYEERLLDLGGFMSGHNIPVVDVLKLDVEGDEIEILKNNFPKDKVRTIIGEYHGAPVRGLLEDLGYRYGELPNQHFIARI